MGLMEASTGENGYAIMNRLVHNSNHTVQVSVVSAALFTAFSIGTALAPNLASFFVFRILTAFQGTAFLVIGSAVIGDIYKPVSSRSFSEYRSCCLDYCGPLQNTCT
jgi:MFS family permease